MKSIPNLAKIQIREFAQDVAMGLNDAPKHLPSKYFYDAIGDQLFQKITQLDVYYLTRCERELLTKQQDALLNLWHDGRPLRIIELGPGDGSKTWPLLKRAEARNMDISYQPVDISPAILAVLQGDFREQLKDTEIEPMAGDYFTAHFPDFFGRRVWLYMGSNIGNLTDHQAKDLLANLRDSAQADDLLCIGYDLKKEPARILAAYNDPQGVTQAFNLNLLERMNRELDANFDPNHFQHVPIYDPEKAEARSYLMSTTDQEVTIGALGLTFMFEAWETILTEISRKFNARQMAELCGQCGWKRVRDLRDAEGDYAISLYRA